MGFRSAGTVLANWVEIVAVFIIFFNCGFCVFFVLSRLHRGVDRALELLRRGGISGERVGFLADGARLLAHDVLLVVVSVKAIHYLRHVSLVSCLEQTLDIDRELDGVTGWSRSKVVLARLQSLSPRVKVHR